MSTLTCFDADPDLRTMVQRIGDCARHQGGPHISDYLARKLARLHDDAVGTRQCEVRAGGRRFSTWISRHTPWRLRAPPHPPPETWSPASDVLKCFGDWS